jgi:hypothetical protein
MSFDQRNVLNQADALWMQVIQLQGDQRKNVSQFLVQAGVVKKDLIKIHGFWDQCSCVGFVPQPSCSVQASQVNQADDITP